METLTAKKPFEFSHSLRFICGFPATLGDQQVDTRVLRKRFRFDGKSVDVSVDSALQLDVSDATCADAAKERVRFFLSLDDDLAPFYARAKDDDALKPLLAKLHGYHQVKFATPFENACWAILTQRCAIPAARVLKERLMHAYGDGAFPEVADLLPASESELVRTIGHAVKARRIAAVARAFAAKSEQWMRTAATEEVRAWLLSIEGIGPWSAAFILLRGLGHIDAIDGADAQLKPHIEALYGKLDTKQWAALHDHYRGYRGYWALYVRTGLSA